MTYLGCKIVIGVSRCHYYSLHSSKVINFHHGHVIIPCHKFSNDCLSQSSTSKLVFELRKMNLTKVKAVFVNNRPRNKTSLILCTGVIIWDKSPKYNIYKRVSADLDNLTSRQLFKGFEKAFEVLDGSIL